MTISLDQLSHVPIGFDHEALSWEAQGIYHQPREPLHAWHHDGGIDERALETFLAPSRSARAQGKHIHRLAAFADPLTDYQRYQLNAAPYHQAAGEQLGWVDEQTALDLDMPDEDFWLLDQRVVLWLRYEAQELAAAVLITEPALVEYYRARLQHAWAQAGTVAAAWRRWPDLASERGQHDCYPRRSTQPLISPQ